MLTKNFKSNKYYAVARSWYKYGNEDDFIEVTYTQWDTLEKAVAYIDRYNKGLKFVSAFVEEITLDKEITREDWENNNYNIVSYQQVYEELAYGDSDYYKPGEIIYVSKPMEELAADEPEQENIVYTVKGTERIFKTFGDALEAAREMSAETCINKGTKLNKYLICWETVWKSPAKEINSS